MYMQSPPPDPIVVRFPSHLIKGGMTWIPRYCKGMCSTWASQLISENHAYATAVHAEPGKLAFLWFCYGNGNLKATVRYVACITL